MEKFYRKAVNYNKDTLEFQALDWLEFNESYQEESDNSEEEEPSFYQATNEKYIIRAFGCLQTKESVCVNILNFTPFFYIKVENNWTRKNIDKFINDIIDVKLTSQKGNSYYAMKKYVNCIEKGKCILQKKYEYDGFTGHREYTFLRLVFNNSQAMSTAARAINDHNLGKVNISNIKYKLKVYESNLPGLFRFYHLKNIKPSGWIKLQKFKVELVKASTCQIEVSIDWKNCEYIDKDINSPFLQASFDIETFSGDLHSFPIATNEADAVIQIATTFKYYTDSNFFVKHLLTLKSCPQIESSDGIPIIIESFDSEASLILAWKKLLLKMDPDIIYGYNSDSFDCNYLYQRAVLLRCDTEFLKMSRLKKYPTTFEKKTFMSSGRGTTEFLRLYIHGRINFDILVSIIIENKLDNYKLNHVSELFLHEKKVDLDIKLMFKYFQSGKPEEIKKIAEYCIMDTCLPQKLVDKLLLIQNKISMSNITFIPIRYLIEKGEQIKTFSLLVKKASQMNYAVPSSFYKSDTESKFIKKTSYNGDSESDEETDERFTGAVVLKPKSGAYYVPICTVDFKSLYPSIMMAYNLCHSTLVKNDKYLNLPEYDYFNYEWDDVLKDDKKKEILDSNGKKQYVHHQAVYATRKENKQIQGVLPEILDGLVNARQFYKDKMKAAKKENKQDLVDVYDKCQLSVKLTMNSIYGFLGAHMLPCKKAAATVTAIGREMINKTKGFIESEYSPAEIVYGDSVTGHTPILLRNESKDIFIETIENIFDENNKVDYPGFKLGKLDLSEKEYSRSNFQVYSKSGWTNIKKVIRHKTNKNIYRIITRNGYVEVTEDHSLLNEHGVIIKPGECDLNTKLLTGYPLRKRINSVDLQIDKTFTTQIEAAKFYLEWKAGFNLDIFYNPFEKKFIVRNIDRSNKFESNKIKFIHEISDSTWCACCCEEKKQYVYDIETEDGTFQAGIGEIIVKNTDSCFIKFNTELQKKYTIESNKELTPSHREYLSNLKIELIRETMELGKTAADDITEKLFKYPIALAYEKVNMPCILLSKKRYIINKYEDSPTECKETSSGILLNRRDNFPLSKTLYRSVKDILMNLFTIESPEKNKVIELINDTINKIINNEIDLSELVITKTYKPVKKNENLPQIALVKKITARDPGNAPRYNDKIHYIITDPETIKDVPQYLKVESPEYIREHNLKIDANYYINYLSKPICELLNFFIDNPENLFKIPLKNYKANRKIELLKINPIPIKEKKKRIMLKKQTVQTTLNFEPLKKENIKLKKI